MNILFLTKPIHMEPLGIMYLSAIAKRNNHNVRLEVVSENLEERVDAFNPDIIGYSVMTGDQNLYIELNNRLKQQRKFISVFGGPHPTFFPELIEQEGVDIICRGEGEEAFSELLAKISNGEDYSHVKNLWTKSSRGISRNEVRNLSDLDTLPFPDRSLLLGIPALSQGPIKHFIGTRGCPFNCSYCFNESFSALYQEKGKRVRFRSPELIVSEVKETVRDFGARFVYFQDDTFTLNKPWLEEFCKTYSKEVGIPFHCHVRANTLDEQTLTNLKNAGAYSVHIAAETADDYLRNSVLRRNMTRTQIDNAAELLRRSGIRFMMQNMIGLPEGSIEHDLKTLEMNIECKPDYAWVSIFQPYPGTRLGEYARAKGFYQGDFSDIGSSFFEGSSLNFSEEYKNQLANLQKLFAIFVENPSLHSSGLSRTMINQTSSDVKSTYEQLYKSFRKIGDRKLYGFDI